MIVNRLEVYMSYANKLRDSLYWWLGKKRPFFINDEYKLEPSSGYKDRIVAFAYGNYIATLLENKLNREYAGESTEKIDINVWQKIAEACKV